MIKQITHYLGALLNITHHEWLRVAYCFTIKTIAQIIFIVSSTLLTATFLDSYHIESLPLLYVITA